MSVKTHKTAQLLNLLSRSEGAYLENPIINKEFKNEVIHIKPDSRKKSEEINSDAPLGINVVAELVDQWLPVAVSRFKCCDCDVCMAEITVEVLNLIPAKYVIVNSQKDIKELEKIKAEYQPLIMRELVRISIKRRMGQKH